MTYYVYKTVNKLNGKIYVGKHRWRGERKDPSYFGSGAIIKKTMPPLRRVESYTSIISRYKSSVQKG